MSSSTEDELENQEDSNITELVNVLDKIDENKKDAVFNANAMQDGQGPVMSFTRNPGGKPPYTREQLLAAGAVYIPK